MWIYLVVSHEPEENEWGGGGRRYGGGEDERTLEPKLGDFLEPFYDSHTAFAYL